MCLPVYLCLVLQLEQHWETEMITIIIDKHKHSKTF